MKIKLTKSEGRTVDKAIKPFTKIFLDSLELYNCFELTIKKKKYVISRVK